MKYKCYYGKMKRSVYEYIGEKRRLVAATTLLGLGLGALQGCNEASPDDTINRVETIHKNSDVSPEDCYDGVMSESGVRADLIDELTHNHHLLDPNSLHGVASTAHNINDALEAMHMIANDQLNLDKSSVVQIGDTYQYCVADDGTVVPGDPTEFMVTTPR